MEKRFCQSTENNKAPILTYLSNLFESVTRVLEIGSGTGQHAVHFAPKLSHLIWHTSDVEDNHETINQWIDDFPSDNLVRPVRYVVGKDEWPIQQVDGAFTANTTHIMQPDEAKLMLRSVALNLEAGGLFCQYGPFNVNGQYTSEGNEKFDQHLKSEGCGGIRDIQELQDWVSDTTLLLKERITMPANNLLLVWQKSE